jgi:hypothetical protein
MLSLVFGVTRGGMPEHDLSIAATIALVVVIVIIIALCGWLMTMDKDDGSEG